MSDDKQARAEPRPTSADPVEMLIDRVAEAVVSKLEERRKIDMIAQAVLQRIQVRSTPGSRGQQDTPAPEAGPGDEREGQE